MNTTSCLVAVQFFLTLPADSKTPHLLYDLRPSYGCTCMVYSLHTSAQCCQSQVSISRMCCFVSWNELWTTKAYSFTLTPHSAAKPGHEGGWRKTSFRTSIIWKFVKGVVQMGAINQCNLTTYKKLYLKIIHQCKSMIERKHLQRNNWSEKGLFI